MLLFLNRYGRLLPVLVGLLLGARGAQAQREYYNWYFGQQAGLTFSNGPQAVTNGTLALPYDKACLSDAAGTYQFSTDSRKVWDRTGRVMAGGDSLSPVQSGVLAVPQPGRAGRYYIFKNTNLTGRSFGPGFSYAVVDLAQRNGLGAVVTDSVVALPPYPRSNAAFLLSNCVAVRHANGRDLWIVAQNLGRQYVSFLLTDKGLQRQPVISPGVRPAVIIDLPALSLLKASADGKTLALSSHNYLSTYNSGYATSIFYHEIASFQPQSGQVTDSYVIPDPYVRGRIRVLNNQFSWYPGVGGLELSPDGSRLYVDTLSSQQVWQYNLLAGTPAAVAASRTVVARLRRSAVEQLGSNLQMGVDGKIYVANYSNYLGRFELPNAEGLASAYRDSAVYLGRNSMGKLPGATNDLNLPPVVITDAGSVGTVAGCAGSLVQFASSLSPFVTASAYRWDFGDPASGPANAATGQAPTHRYPQPGRYTVALRVTTATGQSFTTSQQVTVLPTPIAAFSVADSTLCYGDQKLLTPGPQPAGTTFQWSDGSTGPELPATRAGTYQVVVTNAQGCSSRARITLTQADCPELLPNIITPNNDRRNETLVLPGQDPSHWNIQVFNRWGQRIYQKAPYDNSWNATGQPAGLYYYLLTNPTSGQQLKGWVEVVKD